MVTCIFDETTLPYQRQYCISILFSLRTILPGYVTSWGLGTIGIPRTALHEPGGIRDQGEPCFARVIDGEDVVKKIHESRKISNEVLNGSLVVAIYGIGLSKELPKKHYRF